MEPEEEYAYQVYHFDLFDREEYLSSRQRLKNAVAEHIARSVNDHLVVVGEMSYSIEVNHIGKNEVAIRCKPNKENAHASEVRYLHFKVSESVL